MRPGQLSGKEIPMPNTVTPTNVVKELADRLLGVVEEIGRAVHADADLDRDELQAKANQAMELACSLADILDRTE
jgi:hypothetical protein